MSGGEIKDPVKIGRWDVSPTELRVNDGIVEHVLEAKVMDVLLVLIAREGAVVTREDLIDEVWGTEVGGDERLTRAISLLRKALGDTRGSHDHIRTVPRKGYQLIAPIAPIVTSTPIEPKKSREPFTPSTAPTTTLMPAPMDRGATGDQPSALRPGVSNNTLGKGHYAWAGALVIGLIALILMGGGWAARSPDAPPLVMIMDSAHPARIYDDAVRDSGGTNADILSDILSDLPVRTQKELISPSWHRYEAITQFAPDLIVIHYSGFKQEDASGSRPQLKLLIEYFLKSDTKFLIYSRASEAWLDNKMDLLLEDMRADNPSLDARIDIFPLLDYGEPFWLDQTSAQAVKLKIKDILELE